MKRTIALLTTTLVLFTTTTFAQTSMKEYKVGHVFYVNLPDYMSKTTGINDAAVVQFKNSVKEIYCLILEDNKEDLELVQMKFSSITDYYDNFRKDFLAKEKKKEISLPVFQTIGDNKFIELDATYYDKDVKGTIYYFVGIVETKDSFYKVYCFGNLDAKDKFKVDFQKILYSLKD